MLLLNLSNLNKETYNTISSLTDILNISIDKVGKILYVNYIKENLIKIEIDQYNIHISCMKKNQLIRAIGLACEMVKCGQTNLKQTANFDNLGAMLDCSRNAVLNLKSIKKMIKILAIMGYDSIQLYTEDTFEVEDYKYFGYFRGRYTASEIKDIELCANNYGIEIVPCIQTLAHFTATCNWDYFNNIKDVDDILLIGDDSTYNFIEAMISSVAKKYSSRLINIGMDEAYMVGLGRFRVVNGICDRTEIMIYHINRVVEICLKYGFKPMMWSDMFFRLVSSIENYSTVDATLLEDIKSKLHDQLTLIYWDYYNTDKTVYDNYINIHSKITDNLWFAGGAWKWRGFLPSNEFSFKASMSALQSCLKNGIKNVMVTAWGDDGGECSTFSILPTLQLFAEYCYSKEESINNLGERFKTCTACSLKAFLQLDYPNYILGNNSPGVVGVQPTKPIFYQDILQGLIDADILSHDISLSHYFIECSKKLSSISEYDVGDFKYIFDTATNFCNVLSIKAELGINIKSAYDSKNLELLIHYANSVIPDYISKLEEFYNIYRRQWMIENKVFGFDVIDIRIGGMKMRAKTAIYTIKDYINGSSLSIPELEVERLIYDRARSPYINFSQEIGWKNIATPSVM